MKEVLIVAVLFLAIIVLGRHVVEQRQPVILDDDIYLESGIHSEITMKKKVKKTKKPKPGKKYGY